jgi:hypothetical protein
MCGVAKVTSGLPEEASAREQRRKDGEREGRDKREKNAKPDA